MFMCKQFGNNNYLPAFLLFFRKRCVGTMPAVPTLYGDEASPPVRFALITAALLDIKIKFRKIDLFSGENKTDFYTKINPLQKVPTLVTEDQETIIDSHAIALHLCRKKGTQDLYPEDATLRSRVDQMLFFNAGSLFPVDSSILTDYFAGRWPVDENRIKLWYQLIDHLEHKLSHHDWLTGPKMTLADISCATTVSSLQLLFPCLESHVKVLAWMERLHRHPCFHINTRGVQRLKTFVDALKRV